MQIELSGQHVEVTDAIRNYVNDKFEKLQRHFDHMTNIHTVISVEKTRQKAEATIHLSGNSIFAEAENENMYAAIDSLVDKLDRQIRKHKEKITDHHRGDGRAISRENSEEE
ncbi:MAG: ribosome-associated translation inhibitor RaiA [Gammaproteobacteria bacterium]|nr:ribosome-associated translation inhibitor RaiA [Gammaproteobacteria bacterium]